jgi:hypothetical protein
MMSGASVALADHNLTSVSGHCLLAASLHFDVPFCSSGVHPKISLSLIQALLNWLRLRRARSAGRSGPRDTRANNSPSEQSCTNTHKDVHGNGRKSHFSMTLACLLSSLPTPLTVAHRTELVHVSCLVCWVPFRYIRRLLVDGFTYISWDELGAVCGLRLSCGGWRVAGWSRHMERRGMG